MAILFDWYENPKTSEQQGEENTFRDFGKETAEYRTQPTGEGIDHAAVFAYFHHAEPEGEYSCQSQGYFKSCFGRGEGGVDEFCEYLHITRKDEFAEGHDECDDEECYPDVI